MVNRSKLRIWLFIILLIGVCIFYNGISIIEASPIEPKISESSMANSNLMPLVWTVVVVGGTIAVTLSYVSWRKYKGEEKKRAKKDNIVD